MDTRTKILKLDELKECVAEHRRQGRRVVMANGCFDVLHVGHIRYLQAAKREGDVLVVAVNSDASERGLKGAGRPILPQEARAELVAAVDAVDHVTVFDEPDVQRLLRELRPDVHAKGTDYSMDTVPERELAARMGVRVAIVGDPKDHSTKDLIARVREARNG